MPDTQTRRPLNAKLLDMVADVIERWPDAYNQESYGNGETVREYEFTFASDGRAVVPCGTTHCIAGWAAAIRGWWPTTYIDEIDWEYVARRRGLGVEDARASGCWSVAQDALGLTDAEQLILFAPWWGSEAKTREVVAALRAIARGAPIVPFNGATYAGAQ